jgi:hypothetical protein
MEVLKTIKTIESYQMKEGPEKISYEVINEGTKWR